MNEQESKKKQRWLFRTGTGATNWLWLSLGIIVIDQVTKWLIVENISLHERVPVMPFLDFTYRQNPGAAFGFLAEAGGWQQWLFIPLAIGISAAILIWLRQLPRKGQTLLALTLALVLAGALGNVIDRALNQYVIDFILVYYAPWNFEYPAFNVADSAITIGAVLLVYDAFFGTRPADNSTDSPKD